MPAVHIRNVPEETVARLKEIAADHGRSLEAELRLALDEAALTRGARPRRTIDWPTYSSGITEPFDRSEIYPDDPFDHADDA